MLRFAQHDRRFFHTFSRPGLLYGAPDGAADAWPNRLDLDCESLGQDTSVACGNCVYV